MAKPGIEPGTLLDKICCQKLPRKAKVALGCSYYKKLLKTLKVAQKLSSTIYLCLVSGRKGKCPPFSPPPPPFPQILILATALLDNFHELNQYRPWTCLAAVSLSFHYLPCISSKRWTAVSLASLLTMPYGEKPPNKKNQLCVTCPVKFLNKDLRKPRVLKINIIIAQPTAKVPPYDILSHFVFLNVVYFIFSLPFVLYKYR